MATIENQICEAIEKITSVMIDSAGFDRTIQATIVACVDEASGKYKVKFQDNTFYAYTADINKKYSKGNRVYILIPGNDMTRDKTILGTVGQNKEYSSTEAGVTYKKISKNFIISSKPEYSIYSGTEYNYNEENKEIAPYTRYGKVIYNHGDLTIKMLEDSVIKECVNDSGYIWLEAKFKTKFAEEMAQGNYGWRISLLCGSDDNTYIQSYQLDTAHGVIGDIYHLFDYQYQTFVFPRPDNFIRIERMEIFAEDFEKQLTDPVAENSVTDNLLDIFVSELGIYSANQVSYSETQSGIEIIYPNGSFLLRSMQGSPLPIEAQVYDKGKVMAEDANSFFWFKKDASVNKVSHPKYHPNGGLGWACLNEKNSLGEWVPASFHFDFNEQEHLTIYKNYFKVVSYRIVASSAVQHEKVFTLYNENNYDKIIDIYSNKEGNRTSRVSNDLAITCSVRNKEVNASYEYYWRVESSNFAWNEHNTIKDKFGCNIGTSGGDGVISNVKFDKLSSANNTVTFVCTVLRTLNNKTITLGTSSITIVLEEKQASKYVLRIINGDQIFQYNEGGESPTFNGTYILKPLELELVDNDKNEVVDLDEKIKNGLLTIKWIDSKKDNLIDVEIPGDLGNPTTVNGISYFKKCNFRLKPSFSYDDHEDNNIGVEVTYDDTVLTAYTNFTFLKQGDTGTNGTPYTARIVPILDEKVVIPRWITFTVKENNEYGEFNFKKTLNNNSDNYKADSSHCYVNGATIFPFKIQIFHNGTLVYEGYEGQTTEDRTQPSVRLDWHMMAKNYGDGIKDRSNFEIEKMNSFDPYSEPITLMYNKTLYTNDEKSNFLNDAGELERTPANILRCAIEFCPNITEDESDIGEENSSGSIVETDGDQLIYNGGVAEAESASFDVMTESDYDKEINTREDKTFKIYATLPIVTIINKDSNYDIEFDEKSGYKEVVYNTDACHPWYDSSHETFVTWDNKKKARKCNCYIKGYAAAVKNSSSQSTMFLAKNLVIDSKNSTNFEKIIKPLYKFNGDSVTNAVLIKYSNKAYIHIPIDLHLNRYGLNMLNEWDGNNIEINEEGGYILAPQMGAGKKNSDNTFSGVVMGDVKDDGAHKTQTGLFALNHGERTFSLLSDTGLCAIGKRGRSQIIIDPNADAVEDEYGNRGASGCIYSGNFFKDIAIDPETGFVKSDILQDLWYRYANDKNRLNARVDEDILGDSGMLIDFTNGHIYFANGKFHLRPNGHMQCIEGHITNNYDSIFKPTKSGKQIAEIDSSQINEFTENYFVDLGPYQYYDAQGIIQKHSEYKYFLYCRPPYKKGLKQEFVTFSVKKSGELYSRKGQIGGFYIDAFSLSSIEDTSVRYDTKKRPNVTLGTDAFERYMTIVSPVNSKDETLFNFEEWGEVDNLIPTTLVPGGSSGGGSGSGSGSGSGGSGEIVDPGSGSGSGGSGEIVDPGGGNEIVDPGGGNEIVDPGGGNEIVDPGSGGLILNSLAQTRGSVLSDNGLLSDELVLDNSGEINDGGLILDQPTYQELVIDEGSNNTYGQIQDSFTPSTNYRTATSIDTVQLNVSNLIFAVGDYVGITTEGRLHAKEGYMKNLAFKSGVCEHLVTFGKVRHAYNDNSKENVIVIEKDIHFVSHTGSDGRKYFPKIYLDGREIAYYRS